MHYCAETFYSLQVMFGEPRRRIMSKGQIKFVALVIISLIVAMGVFFIYTKVNPGLELNLVNETPTSSGVVVRFEINNHGYDAWTCDPTKFMVMYSDGTGSPASPLVAGQIIIQSGGSASGLLSASKSSPDSTVVGLSYDDGSVHLTTG
jgi:hypothetical protein